MHPEIHSDKPGKCPKCGMKLVEENKIQNNSQAVKRDNYTPLIVVISFIFLITLTLSVKDFLLAAFALSKSISYFMIGFFVVFSGFKFMDLKGFAEGYSTYDLLAQKIFGYGYIYPFLELFFGVAMILIPTNKVLFTAELIVMTFSGIGVLLKILKHEKFQCACLGTFLKVPLTYVTLIEDFGMAVLALLLLFL